MHQTSGFWPRIISFLTHTVGATAHPNIHYSPRTQNIICLLGISIQVVDCLFGHTPYTLIYNTVACAVMVWLALQDLFFSCKPSPQQDEVGRLELVHNLDVGLREINKKLTTVLQNLSGTTSVRLSVSGGQRVAVLEQEILAKVMSNATECSRMKNVIRGVRESGQKVNTGYLDTYREKLDECIKDATNATQKIQLYLASYEQNNLGAVLQQSSTISPTEHINIGYLESHVKQIFQLLECENMSQDPVVRRPVENSEGQQVIQLGSSPIEIQGLERFSMFIQRVDDGRMRITTQPIPMSGLSLQGAVHGV